MLDSSDRQKRYQVFVSSTYEDLIDERKEIMQVLLELDCIPAGMELFPAADDESWTLIKRVIDNSDYYLVVVGGRYGSTGPDGRSFTQMEFEYAASQRKPIIAFIHGKPGSIPADKTEQSKNGRDSLDVFKAALRKRNCKSWTTPQELAAVVGRSIVHLVRERPAVGWIRADEIGDLTKAYEASTREAARLTDEISKLRETLRISEESRPRDLEFLQRRVAELEESIRVTEERHPQDLERLQNRVSELEESLRAARTGHGDEKQTLAVPLPKPSIRRRNVGQQEAGTILKKVRERLGLRYRDVEEASVRVAARLQNNEFMVALSRLADIENRGTVPSLHRLYSLAVIYRLDFTEAVSWYGIELSEMPSLASSITISQTHLIGFQPEGDVILPLSLDPNIDMSRTTFLSRQIQRWGKLPLALLNAIDIRDSRFAFVGEDDWSMYPLLQPGALLRINERERRVESENWRLEAERPIYFLETRDGYRCCWCELSGSKLIALPHPGSGREVEVLEYPADVDIIGRVDGVATSIGKLKRAKSPRNG